MSGATAPGVDSSRIESQAPAKAMTTPASPSQAPSPRSSGAKISRTATISTPNPLDDAGDHLGADRRGRALRAHERHDRDGERDQRDEREQDVDDRHGRPRGLVSEPVEEERDEQQQAAEAGHGLGARASAGGFRRFERVAHQHRDRHRADAAPGPA